MTGHLLLVDCSAFAYRSYYAAAPIYRESDGQPIGAVLGFMSRMWRLLGAAQADPATHGAAVFDAHEGKSWRHRLYPAYKANRPVARKIELEDQWPYMHIASEALGLQTVSKKGWEADDLIATLASDAVALGMRATICSPDKDFHQLVEDGRIEIVDPLQRRRILEADVLKRWGVDPDDVPFVQALAGDAIDNIPGIDGIGIDKAAKLIRRFGTVTDVLNNARDISEPSIRAQLKRHGARARISLKLAKLRRNVKNLPEMDDLAVKPIMLEHLVRICEELGARGRIETVFGFNPKLVRLVAKHPDPFAWWREELLVPGQPIPEIPQCGFYKRTLIKGGLPVPCRIWREPEIDAKGKPTGMDLLKCEVDGTPRDPMLEWDRLPRYPIREAEFDFERADHEHARRYRPGDPKATPDKPVDFRNLPAPRLERKR